MEKKNIIVSDFDGTVSKKDSLYHFLEVYAPKEWLVIEELWENGEISSKECLTREFGIIPNLSPELIDEYIKTIELDNYFKDFIESLGNKDYDFVIVSDGLDYFINRILKYNGITGLNIITNHAEFCEEDFLITFPNDCSECKKDSGTCKCSVIKNLKNKYDKIIYVGDGTSDFCVADKSDILFAKKSLAEYCKRKNIKYHEYETFKDISLFLNKDLILT